MKSLRFRLFLLLVGMTALVWSLAAVWTVLSARADIEGVLDRRLREAAMMVASLGYEAGAATPRAHPPRQLSLPVHERELSCQIWSIRGALLGRSGGAPEKPLSRGQAGFSEPVIDGVAWRVYTYVSPETGLQVMVGDTKAVRRKLIADLLRGLLIPAIAGLVALAVLIWLAMGSGLAPVRRIAAAIASREPDDHRPLAVADVPDELTALTVEIDELFARIEQLRKVEKEFLASAAHEMQTPLAGLRTNAEIALRSGDETVRKRALERIARSVDRTGRMVRQLLELTRRQAAPIAAAGSAVLGQAVAAVHEELRQQLQEQGIKLKVTAPAQHAIVAMAEDVLVVVLRNLVENALWHGPSGETLTIGTAGAGFFVEDRGKGFAAADQSALVQPFVRGVGAKAPGSGLGLAIVNTSLAACGYVLEYVRSDTGFRAVVRPDEG